MWEWRAVLAGYVRANQTDDQALKPPTNAEFLEALANSPVN